MILLNDIFTETFEPLYLRISTFLTILYVWMLRIVVSKYLVLYSNTCNQSLTDVLGKKCEDQPAIITILLVLSFTISPLFETENTC